jgi:hypothetical protein
MRTPLPATMTGRVAVRSLRAAAWTCAALTADVRSVV